MSLNARRWVGPLLSSLPVASLLFSAYMKFSGSPEFRANLEHLGWSMDRITGVGVLEIGCIALYVIPQTAMLGAILLTGYLGGAVATHVRVGDPWIAPVVLGVLLWGGLFLRDARLQALIPLRK